MRKWINGRLINGNRIDLEVCYYPEHWDRSLWAEDLERMLAAGGNNT